MDIASFEKVSLQDYPDKISTICFMTGCQLRCPYCHNPNLVLPEMYSSRVANSAFDFIEYINKRKNLIEGVVLSGGEPLMQNDIIDLIYKIKELGLSVKLDTNGMLPDRLKELLDAKLLDYIALDYKGSSSGLNRTVGLEFGNTGNSLYRNWTKSLKIVQNSSIDYELRTTVVKEIHSKDHLITMAEELDELVTGSLSRWFLQSFERREDILNDFTNKEKSLSSYSKEEMIRIKKMIGKIIPEVSLRDIF